MGEPILKASDVPTKLPPNRDQSVVKARLDVDGRAWNVTCISMGNPHCVTFGTEQSQVLFFGLALFATIFVESKVDGATVDLSCCCIGIVKCSVTSKTFRTLAYENNG